MCSWALCRRVAAFCVVYLCAHNSWYFTAHCHENRVCPLLIMLKRRRSAEWMTHRCTWRLFRKWESLSSASRLRYLWMVRTCPCFPEIFFCSTHTRTHAHFLRRCENFFVDMVRIFEANLGSLRKKALKKKRSTCQDLKFGFEILGGVKFLRGGEWRGVIAGHKKSSMLVWSNEHGAQV